jgi:hypothetical protein
VVTQNPLPATPTISGPTSFCAGSSVTLTAPAGYSSYSWSNGMTGQSITVSAAGTYRVTVSNGSCTATSADHVITQNPLPATPTISGPAGNAFCENTTATLTAPAGYASYSWNNGMTGPSINVTVGGTYRVTVSNGSCSRTSADYVLTRNPATQAVQPANQTIPRNSSASITASATGTGPFTYTWFRLVSGSSTQVGTGASFNTGRLGKGTYTYWFRAAGTCGSDDSEIITITVN